jgi:hypothetical protein
MSDTTSSYGDPVDEPRTVDGDVVGQAEAGLADAEAAGRGAVNEPAPQEPADAGPAPVETAADGADEYTTASDATTRRPRWSRPSHRS